MNYYPQKNVLVVFGGRNDDNFANTGDSYLNDVWLLFIDKLTWVRWDKEDAGMPPVPRYSHCAAVLGMSVLIFGGLCDNNYCRADAHCLDMEVLPTYSVLERKHSKPLPILGGKPGLDKSDELADDRSNLESLTYRFPSISGTKPSV